MCDLTVVVSTYNRLKHLKKSLHCYERQTYKNFEVVVTDDGSSDGTREYIEEAIESEFYNFDLSYVRQPDRGYDLAGARNRGIELAEGKRILFTDNDIWFSPRSVEFHVKIKPNNIGVSSIYWLNKEFSNRLLRGEKIPDNSEFAKRENIQSREVRGNINVPCPDNCYGGAVSYHRSVLRHAGGFDSEGFLNKYGFEDIDLAQRIMRSPLGVPGGGRAGYEVASTSIGFHIWHPYGKYRGDIGNAFGGRRIREGYYRRVHKGSLKG
mgnify:CR=1 FL=1